MQPPFLEQCGQLRVRRGGIERATKTFQVGVVEQRLNVRHGPDPPESAGAVCVANR
jgi:hypothetical protein